MVNDHGRIPPWPAIWLAIVPATRPRPLARVKPFQKQARHSWAAPPKNTCGGSSDIISLYLAYGRWGDAREITRAACSPLRNDHGKTQGRNKPGLSGEQRGIRHSARGGPSQRCHTKRTLVSGGSKMDREGPVGENQRIESLMNSVWCSSPCIRNIDLRTFLRIIQGCVL